MPNKPIKVFEAFSGIGAQRTALENLGIPHEVVAISEIDKHAIASYEAIHGVTLNLGDISKIKTEDIPDHDLFTYSFPCQDISVAGKQGGLDIGSGTRSGLLWECQKVIFGKKPKYLLLENVKNLVGKKHRHNFDKWLEWLESQGYKNYWKVINSKDHGIPQDRKRVFVVSIHGEEKFEFPDIKPLKFRLDDLMESDVEESFYLSKDIKGKMESKESFGRMGRQAVQTYNELLPKHGNTINPFNMKVSSCNGVSPTLTTRPEGFKTAIIVVDNQRVRKITPFECWMLMGFSKESFIKAESVVTNSQLFKQAGNSIVVDVLEGIFDNLFNTKAYS